MLRTFKTADKESLALIAEEKRIRQTDEVFLLFAMGSQFDHLIKSALEKLGVFCLVADPASVTEEDVRTLAPKGIIVSGGPASVVANPPPFDDEIFDLGIPVLGICLGFQMWAKHVGCSIKPSRTREFGVHTYDSFSSQLDLLFRDCPATMPVLESHGDRLSSIDMQHVDVLGTTRHAPIAAAVHHHLWGMQFHPEVSDTKYGEQIFRNFVFGICGAKDIFPASKVGGKKIHEYRKIIGPKKKVLLALSGGTDSSVVAHIIAPALGGERERFLGVYIKGIDRPEDEAHVRRFFGNEPWIQLRVIDATDRFLAALKGKRSMRSKRIAVRKVYKEVLEEAAAKFGADFIAQGTLYTDISESGGGYDSGAKKAQIKLHHNVDLKFSLPELTPLDDCVKDSGRNIGRSIGVPEDLLVRHPFPGPGLVVRIEGEITADKLRVARQCDKIFIEELRGARLYESIWQAGATVTRSVTTCTKGDDAADGLVVALWAVWSVNGFTAQAAELPWNFLKQISQRLTNEIHEVGAVVYRLSDKPPTTIEWG